MAKFIKKIILVKSRKNHKNVQTIDSVQLRSSSKRKPTPSMFETLPCSSKSCLNDPSETDSDSTILKNNVANSLDSQENDLEIINEKIKPTNVLSENQKEFYKRELIKIIELSKKNEFPPKVFIFNNIEKIYSPIYNFFHCKREFIKKA